MSLLEREERRLAEGGVVRIGGKSWVADARFLWHRIFLCCFCFILV